MMQQSPNQSSNSLQTLFRRFWIPILGLVLGAALGALVSQLMIPIYQSSVYLVVVPASGSAGARTDNNVQEQANNYAQAYSRLVADPSVTGKAVSDSEVGVDPWDVKRFVSVETSPKAPVLQITASSQTPGNASALANALGSGLSSFTKGRAGDTGYQANVMTEAIPPANPALPNWPLNIAVAAAAGLLVGGIVALLWDSLLQPWKAWVDQRQARRIEKEKQRRARREEMERQRREEEIAELEKVLEHYLESRPDDLQRLRQRGNGRYSTGGSPPLGKIPDESQERGYSL